MDQVAYWKSQGQWPYGPYDPYYDYVTLLLNGDSAANAAQNNTFLDSSSNAFTITRNGNTTQGSFSPYGTLWSNYFVGTSGSGASSNYLTTPSSSVWAFGTGAFTLECWGYLTSAPDVSNGWNFFDFRTGTSLTVGWQNNQMYSYDGTNTITSSSVSSYLNTWTHWAWMRSGTTVYLFANGVVIGSGAMSTNFGTSASVCTINAKYSGVQTAAGFFSNARVSNIARYSTSGFTPATTNFTSDSNTLLLTMQNNRFIDNSPNAFTLTVNGTPKVQRFSPFNPTSPYSTATIGGSAYTDSSSDLSIAYNSALNFGSNDFTIEGWWYATSQPTNEAFWAQKGGSQYFILQPSVSGNNKIALYIDPLGAAPAIQGTTTLVTGTWYHVALVRKTNVFTLYLNGVQEGGTYTNSGNPTPSSGTTYINGQNYPVAAGWNGYVCDFRIVNGTAVYTSSFTPPTAPLTNITNTALLCNMTNAGIPDLAMQNDLQTVGSAQVSTSVKKYGTGSLSFPSSSTLNAPISSSITSGNLGGNFTIECWAYFNSTSISQGLAAFTDSTGWNGWQLASNSSISIYFEFLNGSGAAAGAYSSSGLFTTSTWYHIAVCRVGSTITIYVNGSSVASTTYSGYTTGSSSFVALGSDRTKTSNYLNGYIDDFRITNGYARYVQNFTPPTAALPTY
jgi:hypothetical protein